jgi:hypothetical protein
MRVQVLRPTSGAVLIAGSSFSVGGVATGRGLPEPSTIERVTVEIDNEGPIAATLTKLPDHLPHHAGWAPAWSFQVNAVVPHALGPHTVTVRATDDTGAPPARAIVQIIAASVPLTATVTFRTGSSHAPGPYTFNIVLGTTFSDNRRTVEIVSFPALGTDSVTVAQIGGGTGEFHPDSGEMRLPIDLLFHPSSSLASDATLALVLTTGAQTSPHHRFSDQGQPMQANGSIVLVGDGVFQGGFPLGGNDASLILAGTFSPHP